MDSGDLKKIVGKRFSNREVVETLRNKTSPSIRDNRSYKRTAQDVEIAIKASRYLSGMRGQKVHTPTLTDGDINIIARKVCGNRHISSAEIPSNLWANGLSRPDRGWDAKSELLVDVDLRFFDPGSGISHGDFREAISSAMRAWNDCEIGIKFADAAGSTPDIIVQWSPATSDAHGMLQDGFIAHADFPPPNWEHVSQPPLPLCFSLSSVWSVDSTTVDFDIETVAIHELGHCIGLQHRHAGSVMYEVVDPGARRFVDDGSKDAARKLYL